NDDASEWNEDRLVARRHAAAADLEFPRTGRVPEAAAEPGVRRRVHVELPLPRPFRGDIVRQLVVEACAADGTGAALHQVIHVADDGAAIGGRRGGAGAVLDADRVRRRRWESAARAGTDLPGA